MQSDVEGGSVDGDFSLIDFRATRQTQLSAVVADIFFVITKISIHFDYSKTKISLWWLYLY